MGFKRDEGTTDYLVEDAEVRTYEPGEADYLIDAPAESFRGHIRGSRILAYERRHRILARRRAGLSLEQIAQAEAQEDPPHKITARGVSKVIREYVADLLAEDTENAEVVRQLELERLDRMFARLEADLEQATNPRARQGVIRTQLSVMERRAKLMGLDSALQVEHSGLIEAAAIANPEHVKQVEAEFHRRFELPAGEATELPDPGENPEADAA